VDETQGQAVTQQTLKQDSRKEKAPSTRKTGNPFTASAPIKSQDHIRAAQILPPGPPWMR
jgi:hypothetical protein